MKFVNPFFISRGRTTPIRNDTRAQSCAEILHIVWSWSGHPGKTWESMGCPGTQLVSTGCDKHLNAQCATLHSWITKLKCTFYQTTCQLDWTFMKSNKKTLIHKSLHRDIHMYGDILPLKRSPATCCKFISSESVCVCFYLGTGAGGGLSETHGKTLWSSYSIDGFAIVTNTKTKNSKSLNVIEVCRL